MKPWQIFLIVFFSVWLFTACFLIGYSVKLLAPLDLGLEYNGNTISVDKSKLWTSGRYFVGLGYDFLRFPVQQQVLIFSDTVQNEKSSKNGASFSETSNMYPSLNVRTSEGLLVTFEFYVGFKLTTANDTNTKIQQFWEIYSNFGTDYNKFLINLVLSEVRDIVATYEAFDLFQQREAIGNTMFLSISSIFAEYNFKLLIFNLLNMNFPSAFEAAILQTEIVLQNQQTMLFLKDAEQVKADTRVLVASITQNITVSTAVANANASLAIKYAQANATLISAANEASGLLTLKTALNFSDTPTSSAASKLLTYLWIYNMKRFNTTSVNIGLGVPQNLI